MARDTLLNGHGTIVEVLKGINPHCAEAKVLMAVLRSVWAVWAMRLGSQSRLMTR